MIEDTDLYSQKFNENLLQSIYNFFDDIFLHPSPLVAEEELASQNLTNERQRVIKMDCLRTRSTIFDQTLKDDLEIMLTHYCRAFDIKYKQGLNEIAAPFIYLRRAGATIAKCQVLFHKFFACFCLNFYDDDNFNSIEIFVKMFSVVLKYHDPALARYLEWHSIQPQLFCINWLMTLFASKLSLDLVYLLWSFIAAENDKFLLFFLVLAIVQINRENIIESKNINILQVVTNLIFKEQEVLETVIERALLLRKNTPSSIILFFRDRMIFQKRENFTDVALLLGHMQKLNLFLILPGEMTLDKHLAKGICESDCYFCDLRKPRNYPIETFNPKLTKLIETSNDVRTMKFEKQYVVLDLRFDQSKEVNHKGPVFKVDHKQKIEETQERFLSKYIQQKGRKHFVIILTYFTFEDLSLCHQQELELCKKIIKILNSLCFPLISILEGGFDGYAGQISLQVAQQKNSQSAMSENLSLCSFQLPYSFPLKISDRLRLATAFCGDQVSTFVGMVEILLILDYFIFIIPIEKELLNFINYFEHNHAVMQYLYEHPHRPAELLVHKVISIQSLKKASMKVHNQNILVLLYDSCEHQEKRIFAKISNYLEMSGNKFGKLGEICKGCEKKKNKIVIQMNDNSTVKQCVSILTSRYMQLRKKKLKQDELAS